MILRLNARRLPLAGAIVGWVALSVISALGVLPWLNRKFPIVDLAEMVYQVRRLQQGYVPYRDTFTHHFVGYILPFWLLDSVLPLTAGVLKLAAVFLNVATAISIFLTLREIAERKIAWLGAFLTVTVGWFWEWQGFALNLQSYLVPILSLMVLLVVKACNRSSAAAAVGAAFCAGVLVAFDQRALFFLILPLVPFVSVPSLRRLGICATATCAAFLVPGACLIYLWRADALKDFVEQTITFPWSYRNRGVNSGISSFILMWIRFWIATSTGTILLMVVGLAAFVAMDHRRWLKALWVSLVACSIAYSMAGGRLYPNYLLIFAPTAISLMALLTWSLGRRTPIGGVMVGAAIAAWGVFTAVQRIPLSSQALAAMNGVPSPTDQTVELVSEYLRTHTEPDDVILVWGFAPQIYVLSNRMRTFRDAGLLSVAGANFSSTSSGDQGRLPDMVREFDEFLVRTPPEVIVYYVLTHPPEGQCYGLGVILHNFDFRKVQHLASLREAIDQSYKVEMVLDGPCDRAEVFVRTPAGSSRP